MTKALTDEEILKDNSIIAIEFTAESGLDEIVEGLDGFKNATTSTGLLESEETAQKMIRLITIANQLMAYQVKDAFIKILRDNRYVPIANLYIWLLQKYKTIRFKQSKPLPPLLHSYNRLTLNERRLHLLCLLSRCMNYLLAQSIELRAYTIHQGIIAPSIRILDDHSFLNRMKLFSDSVNQWVFKLNWLSKNPELYKRLWHEIDAVQVLIKMAKAYRNLSLYLYITLVNIAYDKEIENLVEIDEAVDKIVEMTIQGVRDHQKKLIMKQEFIDEDENTIHEFEVICLIDEVNKTNTSLTTFLQALYRLSVNDTIKYELYEKAGFKEALKTLVMIGTDIEKQHSIELLAQLCFDDRVNEDLRSDSLFIAKLKSITSSPSEVTFKKLLKTCEQLIWLLSEKILGKKTDSDDNSEKLFEFKPSSDFEHLMISYNRETRDLCLRIKESLEQVGYRVWIDVSDMSGSTLDSMAHAVENANCVLMCVTEKYRQSVNCQAEAQYAFKLNKKIVPLVMQEGYGNVDGWLGLIMGARIFVDFTKYDYDECIRRLQNELQQLNKNNPTVVKLPIRLESVQLTETPFEKTATPQQSSVDFQFQKSIKSETMSTKPSLSSDPLVWSESDVEKSLGEKGLGPIHEILRPLDGKVLHQLHLVQTHTPEFFYKSLTKNDSIDIKLIAFFSLYLKQLFE